MRNAMYFTKTNVYIRSLRIAILTFYMAIRPTNHLYISLALI